MEPEQPTGGESESIQMPRFHPAGGQQLKVPCLRCLRYLFIARYGSKQGSVVPGYVVVTESEVLLSMRVGRPLAYQTKQLGTVREAALLRAQVVQCGVLFG